MTKLTRRQAAKRADAQRRTLVRRALFGGAALLACAIAVAAFFAFRGGGGESTRASSVRQQPVVSESSSNVVKVVDNDFEPRDLTVHKGSIVTFDFKGKVAHNVADDKGGFESGTLSRGDSWDLKTEQVGTYTYFCTLHHAMQGTLRIVE